MKWKHVLLFIVLIISIIIGIVRSEYSSLCVGIVVSIMLFSDAFGIQDEEIEMLLGTVRKLSSNVIDIEAKINKLQKQIEELKKDKEL